MRLRETAGLLLVFAAGCYQPSCNINWDECDNDYDCSESSICTYNDFWDALGCENRRLCSEGCFEGETCVTRPGVSAQNPFESSKPGKQVCECTNDWGCDNNSGSAGYAGVGGNTGGGGSGGNTGGMGGTPGCFEDVSASVTSTVGLGGIGNESAVHFLPNASAFALDFEGSLTSPNPEATSLGNSDVLVVQRLSNGTYGWHRSIGNESDNVLTALNSVPGYVTVATSFKGTIDAGNGPTDAGIGSAGLVALLNESTGTTEWSHVIRTDGDIRIAGVAAGEFNTVIVVGTFSGTLEVGGAQMGAADEMDAFIVAIDKDTHMAKWGHWIGGPADQDPAAVAADIYGNVYIGGSFDAELHLNGTKNADSWGKDAFVMRFDTNGAFSWVYTITGPDSQEVNSLTTASNNGVWAAITLSKSGADGYSDFGMGQTVKTIGLSDGVLLQLSITGELSAAMQVPGAEGIGAVRFTAIAEECADNVVAAGAFSTALAPEFGDHVSKGGEDFFVARFNVWNSAAWVYSAGGTGDDTLESLAINSEGQILAGGRFEGEIPNSNLTSNGALDAFVLEVSP
ncbi:MAG: hypothetical protein IPK82_08875 [Polyangiaceae bacterium]|nr:hypothetical protein [Polyangiaceae bacterium]